MRDVINFNIYGTFTVKDTFPLYDDNDDLIGGGAEDTDYGPGHFAGVSAIGIRCFVAAREHPVSLNLAADLPVYITLFEEKGAVQYGRVTTVPPTKSGQYYFPVNKRYDE